MSLIARSLGILFCVALICAGCYFYSGLFELALDYPTRLAGVWEMYPPAGTFGYYWVCLREVLLTLVSTFSPFGIGLAFAALALCQFLIGRPSAISLPPRIGLLVCIAATLAAFPQVLDSTIDSSGDRLLRSALIPGVAMLWRRVWWPRSLVVLSIWSGIVLIGLSVRVQHWEFGLAGGALLLLSLTMFLHHELAAQTSEAARSPRDSA
jgi:hypothetical protein